MGTFRRHLSQPERAPWTGWDNNNKPCVTANLWVPCDRCHVAEAQVEVVTDMGSVFLCQHHHRQHHDAIVAAGHVIRAWPGTGRCS
jgi:hypothetical protein